MVNINNESFSGLLIEPSLDYNELLTKHRKAYSINSCLSRRNTSETVEFLSHKGIGGIKGNIDLRLNIDIEKKLGRYIKFLVN